MTLAVIGPNVSQIDTSPQFSLGVRGAVDSLTAGVKEYMYVSVAASTALSAGAVVLINSSGVVVGTTTTTTTPGNAAGPRVGVVVAAVSSSPSVQYFWVQIYGVGSVLVLANAAANTQLNSTATSGTLDDDATAGSEVIDGIRLTTANGGSTAATACYINYPFVGRTL